MEKILLLAHPDPGRGDRHLATGDSHTLEIIGMSFGERRQILAHQHHHHHGWQHILQHRHDDVETRTPCSLKHHQLGTGGQLAQTYHPAQQGADGEEEHQLLGNGEEHIPGGRYAVIAPLTHILELLHILDQSRKTNQHQSTKQHRHQYRAPHIAIQNAEHQQAPLICRRSRLRQRVSLKPSGRANSSR